jgi:hypothetical protein
MCDSESSSSEYLYTSRTGHHPNFRAGWASVALPTRRTTSWVAVDAASGKYERPLSAHNTYLCSVLFLWGFRRELVRACDNEGMVVVSHDRSRDAGSLI